MLDQRLREKTREEHAALEKTFLQLIKAIADAKDYALFLRKLYGYYYSLELQVQPFLKTSSIEDYEQRRKAHRLVNDLHALDDHDECIQLCSGIPAVNSYFSALGVMYVLEGSTLGGAIVASMISRKLEGTTAVTFFTSYGDLTMEMWQRFRVYLQRPFSEEEQDEIISAAILTFTTFKQWLELDD